MNDKWWSVLFGIVLFACGALFVVAPFCGWWMIPPVSSHGWGIHLLFYYILAIVGFFYVLTEALLVLFMYRYAARAPGEVRKPSPLWSLFNPLTRLFNTAKKIEIAWTIVPAVILVALAFVQIDTWAEVKYKSRLQLDVYGSKQDMPVQIELNARQFEWRMRYPSPQTWKAWLADWKENPKRVQDKMAAWAKGPQFDDIIAVPNELHIIKNRHVVVQLSTKDVIHSFNMPHMVVKQDALPGKVIPVWFKPLESNVKKEKDKEGKPRWVDGDGMDLVTGQPKDSSKVWQIACAELCGWGHYRMIGRGYVHDTEADFAEWLEWAAARQHDFGNKDAAKN